MTNATTTPAAPVDDLAERLQRERVDEMARRLVSQDVCYCVSGLVAAMFRTTCNEGALIDDDDAATLSRRAPDADDYREAWDYADRPAGGDVLTVAKDAFGVWCFTVTDTDGDETDRGTGYDGTEAGAWRAGFDSLGIDHPDGSEIYEHWLVTDDLARRLRERGESVVDDVQGLTIWGRSTTGQAIYVDAVIQDIARAILDA